MSYPRTLTARLLNYNGTVVGGAPLANAFNIEFYDEEDGPGHGTCSLALSEAGAAQLLPGRYVDCLIEGVSTFTFKIEGNPEYDIIQREEEQEQIIIVQGRGWGCIFDEATVYADYSQEFSLETPWRIFSFASPDFLNAGSWGNAVEQAEYLEGVATANCYFHAQVAPDGLQYPAPIGFPWCTNPFNLVDGVKTANYVDTFWTRTPNQPSYDSTGYYFFRTTFTLADFSPVTFTVTGDNFFTLFLEGVPILGESISTADHWMWQGWKEHQMWLPAGTYTIAAAVYNISWLDLGAGAPKVAPPCPAEGFAGGARYNNPGGLLCALYIAGDAVTAPTHILSSDASWKSHYEANTWPGWTPGQIIQQLIDEALARGAMTVYNSNTFSASLDSLSQAWRPLEPTVNRADIALFSVEVGKSVMQALMSMHEQGFIHWHVRPGTLILDVYRGRLASSPSSSATLVHGVNLAALERNATAPYANALRVQWEGGTVTVQDAAAIAAHGTRVEDTLRSDAPSKAEATLQGETELLKRVQASYPAIVAAVEPTGASDCPYEAFETGDYVTVPAIGGGTEVVRCLAIGCRQDELGYARWITELNARIDVPDRKTTQLLQQIGSRNQVVRGVLR